LVLGLLPFPIAFLRTLHRKASRNRFIAILGMALLVVSGAPLLISALLGQASLLLATFRPQGISLIAANNRTTTDFGGRITEM
jgi:hypothetical protein